MQRCRCCLALLDMRIGSDMGLLFVAGLLPSVLDARSLPDEHVAFIMSFCPYLIAFALLLQCTMVNSDLFTSLHTKFITLCDVQVRSEVLELVFVSGNDDFDRLRRARGAQHGHAA